MLPIVLLPTLLWLGQSPVVLPGATPMAMAQPDYAKPVVATAMPATPPDPVIVCIHRPGDLPFDSGQIDKAAMRILQVLKWSRLREAESIASLGPPAESPRRLVPRSAPTLLERQQRRALSQAIDMHWTMFETRLYEVRMFRHRPEEGQLACRRTAEAWDALLGLIQQYDAPLPPDLVDEVEDVDGWVGLIRAAGA